MASREGKLNSRVAEDSLPERRVGGRSFKVYVENVKTKVNSTTMRKSTAGSEGDPLTTAANLKGSLRNMVKSKANYGSSADINIQRKALADVSNVTGNALRAAVNDSSKPQISVNTGARTVNMSSTKSLKGKGRGLFTQGHEGSRDSNASMGNRSIRSKTASYEFTNNRIGKKAIVMTRKSLPLWKRESQANKTDIKEIAQGSGKPKVISGIQIGSNNRKAARPVTSAKNYLCKNRASDGFVVASRFQKNAAVPPLSRKSVKPIVKTTIRIPKTRRSVQSKASSLLNNSVIDAVNSTKGKVEAVTSSNQENVTLSDEANQRDAPSVDFNHVHSNTSEVVAVGKSKRRRSYTSLLMARSKLLEKHGEAMEDEKLPSIDNDGNQLEVAQYVDEIYQYYWVTEAQNSLPANYMSTHTEITPRMRGILINWLIEVHFKFDLMQETLYLMVTLLDKYLSQVQIKKSEMQLAGLVALLLASKYEDYWHPKIKELISISAESYTRKQMLGMEKRFLQKLKFRLNMPTPYVFMLRFLKAAQSDVKLGHLAFYLIELCLVEYEALNFKPSLLCASAIYVARCTLQMTPTWTPLLCRHSRYDMFQIRDCSDMILRFQRAASTAQLKVTYEKYLRPDLSSVAAIEPLDQLPR